MDMRDLLLRVAASYDAKAGTREHVPGQQLLRSVESRGDLAVPAGYIAKARGGQGTAAATPWIGVFDPGITEDPKQGLYLAYIFSADLVTVTLTLQQGITRLENKLGRGLVLREHLERRATEIRRRLPGQGGPGWQHRPHLRDDGNRVKAYEKSSVVARVYKMAGLPAEEDLQRDLLEATSLLQQAAAAEKMWVVDEEKNLLNAGFEGGGHGMEDPLGGFHPKDSSDYIARIAAKQQLKSREHERLLEQFGHYIVQRGYVPTTTVHPRDLVLHEQKKPGADPGWLVEAKVVRGGNATSAVREAVGQLSEYSYFLYREKKLAKPHLLGLFTEDIGIYSRYLEDHGIASIWRNSDGWEGSPLATSWDMVD